MKQKKYLCLFALIAAILAIVSVIWLVITGRSDVYLGILAIILVFSSFYFLIKDTKNTISTNSTIKDNKRINLLKALILILVLLTFLINGAGYFLDFNYNLSFAMLAIMIILLINLYIIR